MICMRTWETIFRFSGSLPSSSLVSAGIAVPALDETAGFPRCSSSQSAQVPRLTAVNISCTICVQSAFDR